MTEDRGNISTLLEKLGRASTPAVPHNKFGITVGSLISGATEATFPGTALVVGSKELIDNWPSDFERISGVPGIIVEQASSPNVIALVIDTGAFSSGPWLGTDSGAFHSLAAELFEAGRVLRGSGRLVYLLPDSSWGSGADCAFLSSTATAILGKIPEEDLEEQAPQSKLWEFLTSFYQLHRCDSPVESR